MSFFLNFTAREFSKDFLGKLYFELKKMQGFDGAWKWFPEIKNKPRVNLKKTHQNVMETHFNFDVSKECFDKKCWTLKDWSSCYWKLLRQLLKAFGKKYNLMNCKQSIST